ncbi:MAG TPA: HRDC domain-containing protein, partial [bacterium]|nr:HRDC domain-containing protein [bacterium]
IRFAENVPSAEWPGPPVRAAWPERVPEEKIEPLLAACKTLADELRIEPCFLASRAALTAVVQHQPKSIEKLMEVSGMMRWQAELIMPALVLGSAK